jgi:hypothetical protein
MNSYGVDEISVDYDSMLEDEKATCSQRIVASSPTSIAETSDQRTNAKEPLKMGSLALKHQEDVMNACIMQNKLN